MFLLILFYEKCNEKLRLVHFDLLLPFTIENY